MSETKRGGMFASIFGAQSLVAFVALHFSRHETASLVFTGLGGAAAMGVVWVLMLTYLSPHSPSSTQRDPR